MGNLDVCLLGRYCFVRLDGLVNVHFHSTCSCLEFNLLYRSYACFIYNFQVVCYFYSSSDDEQEEPPDTPPYLYDEETMESDWIPP